MPQKISNKKLIILSHSSRLFNEFGYNDTRLKDIADKVGTGKTNISYHFKNKETILEEAYKRSCDFSENAVKIAQKSETGLEKVLAFIKIHLIAHTKALSDLNAHLTILGDFDAFNEPEKELFTRRFDKQVLSFQSFIKEGIDDASIQVSSVEACTYFIYCLMSSAPFWLKKVDSFEREATVESLCKLIKYGIRVKPMTQAVPPLKRSNPFEFSDVFDRNSRNKMKHEALLRTGIRHLNQYGFRKVSLDEIAGELGVTRGAFYYQIADKEQLVLEAFYRSFKLTEKALILADESNSENTATKLEQAIRWLFEGHISNIDPLTKLSLINALSVPQTAVIKAKFQSVLAAYAELLAEGIMDTTIELYGVPNLENIILGSIYSANTGFSKTKLYKSWQPLKAPIDASLAFFEPIFDGFASPELKLQM